MTATDQQNTAYRPRPVTGGDSDTLPTLFRIPSLGGDSSRPATPRTEAIPACRDSQSTSVRVDPPPANPESAPRSYDDLPELPPIDAPAGRSWMETVGSRVVLALLFLAVATVAIIATRDVPPLSGTYLASDIENTDEPHHLAQANPPIIDDGVPSLQIDQAESSNSVTIEYTSNARPETSTSGSLGTSLNPPTENNAIEDSESSLPEMEQIEDGPEGNLPSLPPLPEFADSTNATKTESQSFPADPTSVNEQKVKEEGILTQAEASIAMGGNIQGNQLAVDAINEQLALEEALTGQSVLGPDFDSSAPLAEEQEEAVSLATLAQPVYQSTSTPNAPKDWKQFLNPTQTVGRRVTEFPSEQPAFPQDVQQYNYQNPGMHIPQQQQFPIPAPNGFQTSPAQQVNASVQQPAANPSLPQFYYSGTQGRQLPPQSQNQPVPTGQFAPNPNGQIRPGAGQPQTPSFPGTPVSQRQPTGEGQVPYLAGPRPNFGQPIGPATSVPGQPVPSYGYRPQAPQQYAIPPYLQNQ